MPVDGRELNLLHRSPSVDGLLVPSDVGENVVLEDLGRLLWNEIREGAVVGRAEGEGDGFSCSDSLTGGGRTCPSRFPEREMVEADRERFAASLDSESARRGPR